MVGIVGRIDEKVPTFDRCLGELPMHLPRRVRVGEPVLLPVRNTFDASLRRREEDRVSDLVERRLGEAPTTSSCTVQ